MKLLFFSRDIGEVEHACQLLGQSGIACEVRRGFSAPGLPNCAACMELWLRNDKDAHRAMMCCAEMEIGFYRRPGKPLLAAGTPAAAEEPEEKHPGEDQMSGAA